MPYSRPTLADLVRASETELDTRLPGADARLPASNLNVMARMQAGGLHGLYGFQAWIADQVICDSAESEILDRHAGIWGVARRPAARAQGAALFTGADGAVIPAGTLVQRGDGAQYATTVEAVLAAGGTTAAVRALVPGVAGNLAAGGKLRMVSSIAGVRGDAVAGPDGLSAGADAEADGSLLTRLLERIQAPPHGGAGADYARWAKTVPGVTRAWVYPRELGAGTVTLRFVMDGKPDSIIPTEEEVAAVQARIENGSADDAADARPVTAEVFVVAPTPKPLMLKVALVPGTAATKAAVEDEVRALLAREAVPGGIILRSHLDEAIATAAGETDHTLVEPVGNVAHDTGEIAVFGGIEWV